MTGKRLLIFGNCGSGKTYLAKSISVQDTLSLLSLDDIYWKDNRYRRAQSSKWVSRRTQEFSMKNSWIIEGVYSHLLELTLHRATAIIWLDLTYQTCIENIQTRGELLNRHTISRVEEYYLRKAGSSWKSHNNIYQEFDGEKHKMTSKDSISKLITQNT